MSDYADRYREDRWVNQTTGIGSFRDKTVHGSFEPVWRLWDPEIVDLMNGSDLAAKIVELPTFEMFRRGFDLTADGFDTSAVDDFREWATETFDVETELENGHKWGRGFGGQLTIMGLDDGRDPWEPLDESRVRGVRYINPVDRRYAYAQSFYSDMDAPKYGRPELYLVSNGVATSAFGRKSSESLRGMGYAVGRIHESRCIRFDGVAADVTTQQLLAGWSWSVLQRPYDVLRQFDHAFDSAVYLLSDASQGVLKLQGLVKAMAQGKKAEIEARMEMMELTRGVARAIAIDAGGPDGKNAEAFERQATPFSGIPEMLDRLMMRVASASNMPLAKVFGRGAGGINSAGEAEASIRTWYDQCESLQTRELAPKIKRMFRFLAMDKRSPLGKKGRDVRWHVKFRPLWSPTDDERARTQLTNMQRDTGYVEAGIVTAEVAAASLGDVYPKLDVKAIEDSINQAARFDPYEGDAPEGEGGNPADNGGQLPSPVIPMPMLGTAGAEATPGPGAPTVPEKSTPESKPKAPKGGDGAALPGPQKPTVKLTTPGTGEDPIPQPASATKPKKVRAAKPSEEEEEETGKKASTKADAWNPDQPRDEHGMWSEEGAVAASRAATEHSRSIVEKHGASPGAGSSAEHHAAQKAHALAASAAQELAGKHEALGNKAAAAKYRELASSHENSATSHESQGRWAKERETSVAGASQPAEKSTRNPNRSLGAYKAAETRGERNQAAAVNIPAHMIPLWERTKDQYKGTPHQRFEKFVQHAEASPKEVMRAMSDHSEERLEALIKSYNGHPKTGAVAKTRSPKSTKLAATGTDKGYPSSWDSRASVQVDAAKSDTRSRDERDSNGRWGEDGKTASDTAAAATERADDPISHRVAAEAHREAALARRFAASRSAIAGNHARAGEHSQLAIDHDMQAGRHEAMAMGIDPVQLGALAGHSFSTNADAYDPDQARDEHGMWSEEAAMLASASAHGLSAAGKEREATAAHMHAAAGHRELSERHARLGNTAAAAAHASRAEEHERKAIDHQTSIANAATIKTLGTSGSDDHEGARASNLEAAQAQHDLASLHDKLGNTRSAQSHRDMAKRLEDQARKHGEELERAKAAAAAPSTGEAPKEGAPLNREMFRRFATMGRTDVTPRDVIAGVKHDGVASWLSDRANQPNFILGMPPGTSKEVGGFYHPSDTLIHVRADSPIPSDAKPWGDTFTVSARSAGLLPMNDRKLALMQGSFTHELGHHVHLGPTSLPNVHAQDLVRNAYNARFSGSGVSARDVLGGAKDVKNPAISRYAAASPQEYFAENFHAYLAHNDELRQHDPIGHKMVKDVFHTLGIEKDGHKAP